MADQEKEKRMDEVLDSLLANYSSVEARPGLETRILANLREAEGREEPRVWWSFSRLWAGTGVAAAIIVGFVLISGRQNVAPPDRIVVKKSVPAQPAVQPVVATSGGLAVKTHHRKPSVPNSLAMGESLALNERPAVFPTPTPLSEQEKLLLSYYSRTPREEVIAQSHPDEPPMGEQDQTEAIPDLTHIPIRTSNTR